jgi:hypothetical protein
MNGQEMRRNSKLRFTKKKDRPPLTSTEVRYWKGMLRKIAKVGFEHEYNLTESRGTCEGNTYACPCNHPDKDANKCYEKCASFSTCKLRDKYECPGIYCIEFNSPCKVCDNYVRDCNGCVMFNDPNKKPSAARNNIKEALRPTNDLSKPGENGVLAVIDDGSLLGSGGVEVTTVGRRVNYDSFKTQATRIVDVCTKNNAFLNERASIHTHLVGGYFDLSYSGDGRVEVVYGKKSRGSKHIQELEQPMPDIIIANFHQLLRRYHNALTWITSAGTDKKHLTRWVKFRKPIIKYSALRTPMVRVKQQIAADVNQNGKYAFVNYYNTQFDGKGCVTRFHVEGRFSDGMLSASAIASTGLLLYSMLITAVSISRYGILHSGDADYMEQASNIQAVLMNNDGSYDGPRTSNTSKFEAYRETVRKQAEEMVNILHSELRHHGDALKVLKKLADKPCSMRLIEGDSWEKIEKDLTGESTSDSELTIIVLEAIDTFYVDDCVDSEEWTKTISEDKNLSQKCITDVANQLVRDNRIAWDSSVGTYVRC